MEGRGLVKITKISEENVHWAASDIFREGKPVTISSVRERLGSGSFSTISKFLDSWRAKQAQDTEVPEMSELFKVNMRKIWEITYRDVEKSFQEKKEALHQEKVKLEEEKKALLHEIEKLEIDNSSKSKRTKDIEELLQKERDEFEKRLASGYKALGSLSHLEEKVRSLQAQLDEAKKRAERFESKLLEISNSK